MTSELEKAQKKVRKIQGILNLMNEVKDMENEDSGKFKARKTFGGSVYENFGLGLGRGSAIGFCSEEDEGLPPPLFKPRPRKAERERGEAPSPPRIGSSSSGFLLSSPRGASAAAAASRPPTLLRSDRREQKRYREEREDEDAEEA
jgi:hypothetical protein